MSKKVVSKDMKATIRNLKAFLDDVEFKKLKNEISNIKKSVGLKDYYKGFNVTIGFVSHPNFIIFGGIGWDGSSPIDFEDASKFAEEMMDASKKIQKALETFKKNHPEAKIVKYPTR